MTTDLPAAAEFRNKAYLQLDAQWLSHAKVGERPRPVQPTASQAEAALAAVQATFDAEKDDKQRAFIQEFIDFWTAEIDAATAREKHVPTPEEIAQQAADDAAYIEEISAILTKRGYLARDKAAETKQALEERLGKIDTRYRECQQLVAAGKLDTATLHAFAALKADVELETFTKTEK